MNFGLRRNYAVATSDTGHWGAGVLDARWAMNNPVVLMDWAQRSVPETARVSKLLLQAYYDVEQRKSYYQGRSTGGRMGMMEALRYPKDFDGIIAGAPVLDFTGIVANLFGWVTRANTGSDGKPVLSPTKVTLLGQAVSIRRVRREDRNEGVGYCRSSFLPFQAVGPAVPCGRFSGLPDTGRSLRRRRRFTVIRWIRGGGSFLLAACPSGPSRFGHVGSRAPEQGRRSKP